jgi:hypothetical protein
MARFGVIAVCLLSATCNNSHDDNDVLLLVDPQTVVRGTSVSVRITSKESFFKEDIETDLVSEGGLVLRGFHRVSGTELLAEVIADESTTVGRHEFVIETGGGTGTLAISVLAPSAGPGTVEVAGGDACSSGAEFVRLSVIGHNTSFDSQVTAEIEGADGVTVQFVEVLTATSLEVRYSVSLEQEPGTCVVVLRDGNDEWRIPITIVAPTRLQSQAEPQFLRKGQAGFVRVSNAASKMDGLSRVMVQGDEVEYGLPEVQETGVLDVPLRLPFDTEVDSLAFEVWTFNQGAFLEIVEVEVELLEPTYLAATPSQLPQVSGDYEVTLVAPGFDFATIESVESQGNDHVMVTKYGVGLDGVARVNLALAPGVEEGEFSLVVHGSQPDLVGVVAIAGDSQAEHISTWKIEAGDHRYVTVAFSNEVALLGATLTAEPDEGDDITVHSIAAVDDTCLVLELSSPEDSKGWQGVWIHADGEDFHVSLEVVSDVL